MENNVFDIFNIPDSFSDYFVFYRTKMLSKNGLKIHYSIPKKHLKVENNKNNQTRILFNEKNGFLFNKLNILSFYDKIWPHNTLNNSRFMAPSIYLFPDEEYLISLNGIDYSIKNDTFKINTNKMDDTFYKLQNAYMLPELIGNIKISKIPIINDNYQIEIIIKVAKKSLMIADNFILSNGINSNRDFLKIQFKKEIEFYKKVFQDRLDFLQYQFLKVHHPEESAKHHLSKKGFSFFVRQYDDENEFPLYYKELKRQASIIQKKHYPETYDETTVFHDVISNYFNEIDNLSISDFISIEEGQDVSLILDPSEKNLIRSFKKSLSLLKESN